MHKKTDEPLFHFNAHATGFSGRLTRPFDVPVDVLASCALPPSGGYASARTEGFRIREIIRVDAAYTQVTGSKHDEEYAWNEVATSTIEGLNILGQFTADRITAVMSIKRPFKGDPIFSLIGSSFENLRVGGEPVHVEFDHQIEKWTEAVSKRDPKFDLKAVHPGFCLVTSAVASAKCSRTSPDGAHILDIPQFGRITLGEYWITPYSRSFTMFRAEMGCGFEGRFEGSNVGGNGVRYPPYP